MPTRNILRELCRYNIGTYADVICRNALLYPDQEAFVYGATRICDRVYYAFEPVEKAV